MSNKKWYEATLRKKIVSLVQDADFILIGERLVSYTLNNLNNNLEITTNILKSKVQNTEMAIINCSHQIIIIYI